MSLYSAPSDRDHYDEPWNKPEPCATRGCDGTCDIPSMSAFCYECRCANLIAAAEPIAVECVWCSPPHLISPGRLPASSGLCEKAYRAQMAELDAAPTTRSA